MACATQLSAAINHHQGGRVTATVATIKEPYGCELGYRSLNSMAGVTNEIVFDMCLKEPTYSFVAKWDFCSETHPMHHIHISARSVTAI